MQYNKQQILDIINKQLLLWIKKDETVKNAVFELIHTKHPTRKETNDRFEQLLLENRKIREEWNVKWEKDRAADRKQWEEQMAKWEKDRTADRKQLEERMTKWEKDRTADRKQWEERMIKWDEDRAADRKKEEERMIKWEEDRAANEKKWEENKKEFRRVDLHLSAIGARWGVYTEASFRNALIGILEELHTDYKVENYNEYDEEGMVFGKPDQVEIDVIIKNQNVYLTEIKSFVNKNDIYVFLKKIKFYEKQHKREVSQGIVISPEIDAKARKMAEESGIKLFSYPDDVSI